MIVKPEPTSAAKMKIGTVEVHSYSSALASVSFLSKSFDEVLASGVAYRVEVFEPSKILVDSSSFIVTVDLRGEDLVEVEVLIYAAAKVLALA